MKHERDIKPEAKKRFRPPLRLKKTLARRLSFRPIENEDVRYAWAAYKKGSLAPMAGVFTETGMSAGQFREAFETTVLTRYHAAWTLFAESVKGFLPVGFVFAFHSHSDPVLSPFMIVGDIVWCPWATPRNRMESAVNFFNMIRHEIPMVDYAHGDENKKFMEMLARHGIMRRVGTTFNVVKGEGVAVFETRAG